MSEISPPQMIRTLCLRAKFKVPIVTLLKCESQMENNIRMQLLTFVQIVSDYRSEKTEYACVHIKNVQWRANCAALFYLTFSLCHHLFRRILLHSICSRLSTRRDEKQPIYRHKISKVNRLGPNDDADKLASCTLN